MNGATLETENVVSMLLRSKVKHVSHYHHFRELSNDRIQENNPFQMSPFYRNAYPDGLCLFLIALIWW